MVCQPLEDTLPGCMTAGKAGGQQVTARRRFPIQHLARAKHTRQGAEHQALVQLFKSHTAGTADRFIERPRGDQRDFQLFNRRGQAGWVEKGFFGKIFV